MPAAWRAQPRPRPRAASLPAQSAPMPNRNSSSSLMAENHITASWWPSATAKKPRGPEGCGAHPRPRQADGIQQPGIGDVHRAGSPDDRRTAPACATCHSSKHHPETGGPQTEHRIVEQRQRVRRRAQLLRLPEVGVIVLEQRDGQHGSVRHRRQKRQQRKRETMRDAPGRPIMEPSVCGVRSARSAAPNGPLWQTGSRRQRDGRRGEATPPRPAARARSLRDAADRRVPTGYPWPRRPAGRQADSPPRPQPRTPDRARVTTPTAGIWARVRRLRRPHAGNRLHLRRPGTGSHRAVPRRGHAENHLHDSAEELRFRLEGRLSGPWVTELRQCWQTAQSTVRGRKTTLDLGRSGLCGCGWALAPEDMHRHGVRAQGGHPAHPRAGAGNRTRRPVCYG